MTNREKINSLSNEELTNFMLYNLEILKRRWTHSYHGIVEWLDTEFEERAFENINFTTI